MTCVNSTVAISATPIGMPGWPDFACSTASMASARMALAIRWCWGRADWLAEASAVIDAAAAETAATGGMGSLIRVGAGGAPAGGGPPGGEGGKETPRPCGLRGARQGGKGGAKG